MTYCLDTNVFITLIRQKSETLLENFTRGNPDDFVVSEVVRAELYFGCLKSTHPNRERAKVDHLLDAIKTVPFSGDAVEHYASIRSELEKSGNVIGANDLLIAATARSIGAVMVTANVGEFARVPGLVVEDWTV